jgi:hypothetical protein
MRRGNQRIRRRRILSKVGREFFKRLEKEKIGKTKEYRKEREEGNMKEKKCTSTEFSTKNL